MRHRATSELCGVDELKCINNIVARFPQANAAPRTYKRHAILSENVKFLPCSACCVVHSDSFESSRRREERNLKYFGGVDFSFSEFDHFLYSVLFYSHLLYRVCVPLCQCLCSCYSVTVSQWVSEGVCVRAEISWVFPGKQQFMHVLLCRQIKNIFQTKRKIRTRA